VLHNNPPLFASASVSARRTLIRLMRVGWGNELTPPRRNSLSHARFGVHRTGDRGRTAAKGNTRSSSVASHWPPSAASAQPAAQSLSTRARSGGAVSGTVGGLPNTSAMPENDTRYGEPNAAAW
jgi:hypothetical protein